MGPWFPEGHAKEKQRKKIGVLLIRRGMTTRWAEQYLYSYQEAPARPGVRGPLHIDQDARPVQKCLVERECSSHEDRVAVIVSPATADLEPYLA